MTREIGDILIREVLNERSYDAEKKIKLVEKVEKLLMFSLGLSNKVLDVAAEHVNETVDIIPAVVEEKKEEPKVEKKELPTRATKKQEEHKQEPEPVQQAEQSFEEYKNYKDDRTKDEIQEAMNNFEDPSDPDFSKSKALIILAKQTLDDAQYQTMAEAYNKPETYQRLINLWNYMHNNADWPALPDIVN